jgi:hypothetical protein
MTLGLDSATHCERDDVAEDGINRGQDHGLITRVVAAIDGGGRDAIEHLSEILFWKMEHLDPTDAESWEGLDDRKKEFYRLCVRAVLLERTAVLQVLSLV